MSERCVAEAAIKVGPATTATRGLLAAAGSGGVSYVRLHGTRDQRRVLRSWLCDEALGEAGIRQHRFDWLLGDPGTTGRQVRLPVDGYWPQANLVVEYRERQHDQPVPHFDKPGRLTVSGVHRGLQRALYDARRDELIPAHGISLIVITPGDLDATPRGRLRRNADHDLRAIARIIGRQGEPL